MLLAADGLPGDQAGGEVAGVDAAGGAGGLPAPERFKVETERHRVLLQHAQELAMEEFHRSLRTIDVKRVKIDPKDRKHEGGEQRDSG